MNTTRPVITGQKCVVTTGHYLATSAGLKMVAKGGNAIDAGVAAGFALAVLKPHENSLGGECPILVYSPIENKVVAISGQGLAPQKATIAWFAEHNIDTIPGDGALPATVPGLFGAYGTALQKYGKLSLADVLQPAIELAEKGFPVYAALRNCILANEKRFREEWQSSADVFLPDGNVPEINQVLLQPALAKTFRTLLEVETKEKAAQCGREETIQAAMDCFYGGEITRVLLEYAQNTPVKDASGQSHTTLLTMEDFASYQTKVEAPVSVDYKNYTVYKCGPWTQGPVFLQQLKLLEGFNLKEMQHNSAQYIHTLVECAKLAFSDRERYYGDPEFSKIPMDMLLSEQHALERRNTIDPRKANTSFEWEKCVNSGDKTYTGDTTHLDVIDAEGWMISATPSGGWIPSSPVIPLLGFPLGTRAQVFNLKECHPNCLVPGKRPRTTLTPSIAFHAGKPWMAFGTQGGDMQDQWTLQFFLNVLEFGMNLQEAIDAASFHTCHFPCSFYPHQVEDRTIFIEDGIGRDTLMSLQTMGHKIHLLSSGNNGQVCAATYNLCTGMLESAASAKYDAQAYATGW